MANKIQHDYNPDVLSCLANLSSDEVFTPPDVVKQMLDLLPQELFQDKSTRFLDPVTKSGVFLREIAKRLISGLEDEIPDLQTRVDHIFQNQLFGIAITELTSLLSRRSLYCSKYPNSVYSASLFDDIEGNIRFKIIRHAWNNGKCAYCGASQQEFDRGEELETHAYEFIHTAHPERIFNMRFDVIIGNPPYQLDTGGSGRQARPIYPLFIAKSKMLGPRYLSMIIPSRWFAGGMGLDGFRREMLNDNRISHLVDFPNAKECFPQSSISGGVCYFLWERDYQGDCLFTNVADDEISHQRRVLNEFPVLVRYNKSVDIIHKIREKNEDNLIGIVSSISPFGIPTSERGQVSRDEKYPFKLYSSAGEGFVSKQQIAKGFEYLNEYKVLVSQTSSEHAGEPARDGRFRVLTSSIRVLGPTEVCTHSYLVLGPLDTQEEAENLADYLKLIFVRFLILQALTSIHITKNTFIFVPIQDFSVPWTDKELYHKYNLTDDEIAFIESMIRPMEPGGEKNVE